MKVIRDIWVCEDCYLVANTGDATFLDYSLGEREAAARLFEIDEGLAALPGLVDDASSEAQRICTSCDHIGAYDTFEKKVEVDDFGDVDEVFFECPKCHSYDTEYRESGHNEFSWAPCHCCDSHLGGSRHRMAQLIREENAHEA